MLRCEDLKQEREAVVDGMMELESEFLTATNEKEGSNDIGSSMHECLCWQIHQEAVAT